MREWAGLPLLTGVVFLVGCGGYTTLTATPLPTSTLTSAPTATLLPTSTPTPAPTATPIRREYQKIIANYRSQIDKMVRERDSDCGIDRTIKNTVRDWSDNSIIYLRAFWEIPDLNATDVRSVIDYLEGERGRYERLCLYERDGTVLEARDAKDIKRILDAGIERNVGKDKPCEIEGRLRNIVDELLYSNINYIKGFFNAPSLTPDDLSYLIAYYESESGRHGGLCVGSK